MWIELPITWLIIVNILAWFFFHMSISYLMLQVPDRWFDKQKKYFCLEDGKAKVIFGERFFVYTSGRKIYQMVQF